VDDTADGIGGSSNDFSGLNDAARPPPTEIEENPFGITKKLNILL
jgi:hypothetical protein